jgi:CheY-like chemotaxis protein
LVVLVVDDHQDTRDVVARLLRMLGHRAFTAGSCAEARAMAGAYRPLADGAGPLDVVLGDIDLPDGDGLELLRELRTLLQCHAIALTGHGLPGDLERSRAHGVERHLVKPIGVAELRAVLAEVGNAG